MVIDPVIDDNRSNHLLDVFNAQDRFDDHIPDIPGPQTSQKGPPAIET
jgi:hypothetical protein